MESVYAENLFLNYDGDHRCLKGGSARINSDQERTIMETCIDFRGFEPRARHALFFSLFEGLKENAFFDFVNDHDPVPLQNQIRMMNIGNLRWEYAKQGPEYWKIRISKVSDTEPKKEGCCGLCGGHE